MSSLVRHRKKRQRSPQTVAVPEINYSFYVRKFITEPGDLGKKSFLSCGTYKLVFRLKLDNYDRVLMFTFSSANENGVNLYPKEHIELFFPYKKERSIRCLNKMPQTMDAVHMNTLKSFGIYLPQRMFSQEIKRKKGQYKIEGNESSDDEISVYVYVYEMPFLGYELPEHRMNRYSTLTLMCKLDHVYNILNNLFPNIIDLTYSVGGSFAYHIPDIKIENTVCDGHMISPVDLEELIIWDKRQGGGASSGASSGAAYITLGGDKTEEYIETFNYDIQLLFDINSQVHPRLKEDVESHYLEVSHQTLDVIKIVQGGIRKLDFTRGTIVISFTLLKLFFDIVYCFDRKRLKYYVQSLVSVLYVVEESSPALTHFYTVLGAIMRNDGVPITVGSNELRLLQVPMHHYNSIVLLFILNNMCSVRDKFSILCFQRPKMRDNIVLRNNNVIITNTLMRRIHKAFCAVYSTPRAAPKAVPKAAPKAAPPPLRF